MLRCSLAASSQASLTGFHGALAPTRRLFFKASTPRALVYTPPGSGREGTGLPWYQSSTRPMPMPQQQQQQQQPREGYAGGVSPSTAGPTPAALDELMGWEATLASGITTAAAPAPIDVARASRQVSPVQSTLPQQQQQQQQKSSAEVSPKPSPNSWTGGQAAVGGASRAPRAAIPHTSGPSLDTRIEEIIRVEADVASEMLPAVVQLLIDAEADGVERITMGDFVAMQPRRRLAALGGRKQWLEFLENSTYYQQVARLATDSPQHDLRALRQAGITTLFQWTEKPNLVSVSARTRSALDGAVEHSIRVYMNEVAQLVNTSSQLEGLLNSWVSDVVGKFILDSLKISTASAAAALRRRRGEATEEAGAATLTGGALRPGEVCTLEHYFYFTQKVLTSVRQDVRNSTGSGGGGGGASGHGGAGDAQAEAEIHARTETVIAAALTQLLEQAVVHHLPPPLRPLYGSGYIALDRVPALLRRAVSLLKLRDIPVRHFVFHSTAEAATGGVSGGGSGRPPLPTASAAASAAAMSGKLNVSAPQFGPGTFLTGSTKLDVTLGQWSGAPEPPSSTYEADPAQLEYLSVLRRVRTHLDRLSMTPLLDVVTNAAHYGAHGFEAFVAMGLDQLFGHAKLVEDRLVSLLSYPLATMDKPMHFVEAGYTSGKTAVLERLARRTRAGERAAMVRYGGTSTPFIPDLDDHPLAFPARFWFRVALALCPYLIHTEALYSRAPRSVLWWGNATNWSWESFQNLIACASRRATASNATGQLSTILVDDMDRLLDAMEAKWSLQRVRAGTPLLGTLSTTTGAGLGGAGVGGELVASSGGGGGGHGADNDAEEEDGEEEKNAGEGSASASAAAAARTARARREERRRLEAMTESEERQLALGVWMATGKTIPELLSASFAKLTVALGQVNFVFTGQRVSPILQHYTHAPVRRYFMPVSSGVGLPQRLRMLPLLSVLHALHLRSQVEMPGLLYEVLKNAPALAGKTIEVLWSTRVRQLRLHTLSPTTTTTAASGAGPRLLFGDSGPLVHAYAPHELYAELPLRSHLLHHPRRARLRLVELLQRQLSSPTGYLTTGVDTDLADVRSGFVTPHSHTASQVHPFALFTIFSQPYPAAESAAGVGGIATATTTAGGGAEAAETAGTVNGMDVEYSPNLLAPTGKERKIVRAWAEVWAEYCGVVSTLATTPERKREAMRVLLHGALMLRCAAVAGASLDGNLKVPSYGFPLLSTEVRMRGRHVVQPLVDGAEVRPATADTVRRAAAAYKAFFSNASQSHFPFRPMMGLNSGCDVVCISGSTLALYDIVTTVQELQEVPFRVAEALVGVLHVLERQVMPVDKVKYVHYVTVVSMDQAMTSAGGGAGISGGGAVPAVGASGGGVSSSSGAAAPGSPPAPVLRGSAMFDVLAATGGGAASVPYLLDLSALFEDRVLDRLKALQEPLGITKDFRTLHDILDELERRFSVRVRQEVVASTEELEGLLSPTLLQLVPDATVLPPYTQAMVTAEDLMLAAMMGGSSSGASGGVSRDVRLLTGVDGDEDALMPGAEADDMHADQIHALTTGEEGVVGAGGRAADALLADSETLHESAELLEAMMNDGLDALMDSAPRQAALAGTAQELRNDFLTENRINYGASPTPAPPSTAGQPHPPQSPPLRRGAGGAGEVDSLAWLHDIITHDSLLAGLQGGGSPLSTTAGASEASGSGGGGGGGAGLGVVGHPTATATATTETVAMGRGGTALSSGLQDDDDEEEDHSGHGSQGAMAPAGAGEEGGEGHDAESQEWRDALAEGGVEATENVFPATAARRRGARRARGAESTPASSSPAAGKKRAAKGKAKKGRASASGSGSGGGGEEVSLVDLLDQVGSQTSRARRAAAAGGRRGSGKRKAGGGGRSASPGGSSGPGRRKSDASLASSSSKKPAGKKTKKK